VAVRRLGEAKAEESSAFDDDPLVDRVHQVCLLLRYVGGLEGLAEGAAPLDGAVAG
jgi:hypothetical protein